MGFFGKSMLSRLSVWIEYALLALTILAFILTISLPWSVPAAFPDLSEFSGFAYGKYLAVLAVSGILAVLILWQARCIFHIVNKGNPFIREMVKRLRVTGKECLTLAAVYFLALFFLGRLFVAAAFVTFSVVGLLLFICSRIFDLAISYKEENDRTV